MYGSWFYCRCVFVSTLKWRNNNASVLESIFHSPTILLKQYIRGFSSTQAVKYFMLPGKWTLSVASTRWIQNGTHLAFFGDRGTWRASAPSNLPPLITKRDKWAISSDIGVLEPNMLHTQHLFPSVATGNSMHKIQKTV